MKTSEKFKKKRNPSSQTKGLGLARIYACENKATCAWRVEKNFKKNDSVLQPISYQCKCRIWGVSGGGGCRLHCSPHNLSLSIISSLAILTAQKKYNRRETNRNRKPTKKQITTTTKAKKEDPPPDREAFPSRHPLRHLGGKFLHICAFLWRSLQVWSRLWFQAGLEV